MKKIILLFSSLFLFFSCLDSSNDVSIDIAFDLLPIDSYTVPDSFTFGEKATIKLNYSLPNGCYFFDNVYVERQNDGTVIGIRAVIDNTNSVCTEAIVKEEYDYEITIDQVDDYIFKFYKGTDANGDIVFEEVIVPVN